MGSGDRLPALRADYGNVLSHDLARLAPGQHSGGIATKRDEKPREVHDHQDEGGENRHQQADDERRNVSFV